MKGLPSAVSEVATDPSANQETRQYQLDVTGGAKTFPYDANGNLTAAASPSAHRSAVSNPSADVS
jgi:hypothetical protein